MCEATTIAFGGYRTSGVAGAAVLSRGAGAGLLCRDVHRCHRTRLVSEGAGVHVRRGRSPRVLVLSLPSRRRDIRTSQRVTKLVMNDQGEVIMPSRKATGKTRVKARKAVIFATGGFTHDPSCARTSCRFRLTAVARPTNEEISSASRASSASNCAT